MVYDFYDSMVGNGIDIYRFYGLDQPSLGHLVASPSTAPVPGGHFEGWSSSCRVVSGDRCVFTQVIPEVEFLVTRGTRNMLESWHHSMIWNDVKAISRNDSGTHERLISQSSEGSSGCCHQERCRRSFTRTTWPTQIIPFSPTRLWTNHHFVIGR